jgi:hypothetical protein
VKDAGDNFQQWGQRLLYYKDGRFAVDNYFSEVYTWMNHHVEAGHGPPNLFITLSCAEYYWPDVLCLIKTRMEIAKDVRAAECHHGSK